MRHISGKNRISLVAKTLLLLVTAIGFRIPICLCCCGCTTNAETNSFCNQTIPSTCSQNGCSCCCSCGDSKTRCGASKTRCGASNTCCSESKACCDEDALGQCNCCSFCMCGFVVVPALESTAFVLPEFALQICRIGEIYGVKPMPSQQAGKTGAALLTLPVRLHSLLSVWLN